MLNLQLKRAFITAQTDFLIDGVSSAQKKTIIIQSTYASSRLFSFDVIRLNICTKSISKKNSITVLAVSSKAIKFGN